MIYSIHKCGLADLGARAILKWLASRTTSTPMRAMFKYNVVAMRWELDAGKYSLVFIMDSIVSLRSMNGYISIFEPGLKTAYAEIEIDLVEVRAQKEK